MKGDVMKRIATWALFVGVASVGSGATADDIKKIKAAGAEIKQSLETAPVAYRYETRKRTFMDSEAAAVKSDPENGKVLVESKQVFNKNPDGSLRPSSMMANFSSEEGMPYQDTVTTGVVYMHGQK